MLTLQRLVLTGMYFRTESRGRVRVPRVRTWCEGVRLEEVLEMLGVLATV